jgi:DNA-binding NarL/FixJ family response regulator
VGGDSVSYGRRPKDAPNWREHLLTELTLDPARTHFVGRLPFAQYVRVLQVSAAHVYLSYPFVLSWSLLEAMACAAPIVGSDTASVREAIRHGQNGRLVGFFDVQGLAQAVVDMLNNPAAQVAMRKQARGDSRRYSVSEGVAGYDRLVATAPPALQANGATVGIASVASRVAPDAEPFDFNCRDRELLQLLSAGHSTEEIAALRHRSPATVRNQLSLLYQKLGVARRSH